jgi:hypothetical protein
VILAHQGGWDEFLLVAAPVAFFGFLLWLANRRAQAQLDRDSASAGEIGGAVGDTQEPERRE